MRSFNTAGPVDPQDHYCIRPLDRMDLDYILRLIQTKKYFILHAPRQTGKTSALLALQNLLNSDSVGPYRCVYLNAEVGQAAREDVGAALQALLGELASRARSVLQDTFVWRIMRDSLALAGPYSALMDVLNQWAEAEARPLVLLIDEIDALVGDTLLAVLRQLRAGYDRRPESFPQSIVLCGVRDLRDYRIHSSSRGEPVTGGSAFNISAASLRLGDFSRAEIDRLLDQHTADTGQEFLPAARDRVWTQTQGQPWLVNALGQRTCFEGAKANDRAAPITEDDVLEAQEQLILERVVHLDQLGHKLQEDRVRRVIEPLLTGAPMQEFPVVDYDYVRDLGLIARDDPVRIANPIYAEVVPRELTFITQKNLHQQMAWYVDSQGGLDLGKLLAAFQDYFRQHSESWLERYGYKEAGPQLLLQAFLQRIVNGGGRIEREYGLGLERTDLLVIWPLPERTQRFVIECKLRWASLEKTISDGLAQTVGYMDKCGAEAGHLVVFDRGPGQWAEKIFRRREEVESRFVEVWGM